MCVAFLFIYPKPELRAVFTAFKDATEDDWLDVAIEYGYMTDFDNTGPNDELDSDLPILPRWTAAENGDQECGALWYNELWNNPDYKELVQLCVSHEETILTGFNYWMDAIYESDYEVYVDTNECSSDSPTTTESDDMTWDKLCNPDYIEDSANLINHLLCIVIGIFIYVYIM